MTAVAADVMSACQPILGPVAVITDLSWPGSANRVVEVRDLGGQHWIAKTVEPALYQRELTAMRRWAPALRGAAPALRAADDRLRLLIMTRCLGRSSRAAPRSSILLCMSRQAE